MKIEDQYSIASEAIRWSGRYPYWTKRLSNRQWIGKRAGSMVKLGYRLIQITHNGIRIKILAHRLRWFMETGNVPTILDHIDRDKDNNDILNLREVTHSQNARNKDKLKNATSRYCGVYWNKHKNKWQAQISLNGTTKSLGRFNSEKEAARARDYAVLQNDLQDYCGFNLNDSAVLFEK